MHGDAVTSVKSSVSFVAIMEPDLVIFDDWSVEDA